MAGDEQPPRPFFELRKHRSEYAGPGREDPAPAGLSEILIGYFGPSDPAHPDGGDLWVAAGMAINEANAAGGYQGTPFRLIPGWSANPWGSGVVQVTRMAYRDRVWAIIGSIDGPATHLAEQVAVKARLTLISPGSTDTTVNLANVPWMFSCLPGDHLGAPVLAGALATQGSFLVLSANDHDSHHFTRELTSCFGRRRLVPRYHIEFKGGAPQAKELAERVVESKVQAVVLVAGAGDSACLIKAIRSRGFTGAIFGGPAMGRRRFLAEAGAQADGVVFPLLLPDTGTTFATSFRARTGRLPDYATAAAYDAVRLLVAAIRKVGLNRARIRDAVRELSPWPGAAGTIRWDPLGSNARPVRLGTIKEGRHVALLQRK